MTPGWAFLVAGLGTYAIRLSAIALVGYGVEIPPRIERMLRLIAPAVLASIIANGLVLDGGRLNTRASWYLGAALAILVMRRVRSAAWAMTAAMLLVWALQQAGLP
jgi:branched-subunit amino acid transport protein